jgi:hypothetical protein
MFTSQDQYVENSDLENLDNEKNNSWDILVDKAVFVPNCFGKHLIL